MNALLANSHLPVLSGKEISGGLTSVFHHRAKQDGAIDRELCHP